MTFDFFRCADFVKNTFQTPDFWVTAVIHVGHASVKNTVDTDNAAIARFHGTVETNFHPDTFRAANGHHHFILHLKNPLQHRPGFV